MLYRVCLHTLNKKTHAKTSQCVGRLRRLEATGVQRRKELLFNLSKNVKSYFHSAMPPSRHKITYLLHLSSLCVLCVSVVF